MESFSLTIPVGGQFWGQLVINPVYDSYGVCSAQLLSFHLGTVGRDEAVIREYIRNQEHEDERLNQMGLWR